jgi:hypothetical protein
MTNLETLLPCPFCGSTPERKFTSGGSELFIECRCGARMFAGDDLVVVERWNRRAAEPPADSTPLERAFSEEPARSITEAALRKIAEPTRECWLCHDTDPVNQSLCREKNGTGCGTMRDKSTGDIVTPNREGKQT